MKVYKWILILFLVSLVGVCVTYFLSYSQRASGSTGCSPMNFRKETVEGEKYLKWETSDECVGYVKYGLKDNAFPYLAVDVQGAVRVNDHVVKLGGIDTGITYYVVIFSGDITYGKNGLPLEIRFD